MQFLRYIFLTILFFLFSSGSRTYAAIVDRELEIELDPVEGAKGYEIKITPVQGTPGEIITEKMAAPEIKRRLPLGHWSIAIRSFDRRNVPGKWKDLGTVDILFTAPKLIAPEPNKIINKVKTEGQDITFRWDTFNPAAAFEIEIAKIDGEIIKKETIQGSEFSTKLPPGSYRWTLKSILPDGVSLDGKDPDPSLFQLLGNKLADPAIQKPKTIPPESITWSEVPQATSYKILFLRIKDASGTDLKDPVSLIDRAQPTNSIEIPPMDPGTYKLTVVATAENYESSRERKIQFRIKKTKEAPKKTAAGTLNAEDPKAHDTISKDVHYTTLNLTNASVGPVFWSYSLTGDNGASYSVFAATFTAISADTSYWFSKNEKSAWGIEFRGRQTNIFLFKDGSQDTPDQSSVTVADRRLALLLRHRSIFDRVGLDAIIGMGGHHYTYLIQEQASGIVSPDEGNLMEFYLGASADWRLTTGHRTQLDLAFHPVGASAGLTAVQTRQYTATLRFLQSVIPDRAYLNWSLEYFRSRVTVASDLLGGTGSTTSTWYRFGAGLTLAL